MLAFARRMEAKLDRNRHKGDRHGWLGMPTRPIYTVECYDECRVIGKGQD